jgi:hypothetical protein
LWWWKKRWERMSRKEVDENITVGQEEIFGYVYEVIQ